MKYCGNCGKSHEDEAKICENCGALLNTAEKEAEAPKPPVYQVPPVYQKVEGMDEEPISLGKFILYRLIPLIPGVGGLIYLIMLFIWSFGGTEKNMTFRNWAKSELILMLIGTVVFIIVAIIIASVAAGFLMSLEEFSASY